MKDLFYINDGIDPFHKHSLFGLGGLGYKPYLNIHGGKLDKNGNWIDITDKIDKMSKTDIENLLSQTNEDLLADYVGYNFDIKDKLQTEKILLNNELLNKKILFDNKIINKQENKIDELQDDVEEKENYIDNFKQSKNWKEKFDEEGVNIKGFNWDKIKITDNDITKLEQEYDKLMDIKNNVVNKLLEDDKISDDEYNLIKDYPFKDIENINKLIQITNPKLKIPNDILLNMNSTSLEEQVNKLKPSMIKQLLKSEFVETYGELPSKKFEEESTEKIKNIEKIDLSLLNNIDNAGEKIKSVLTYNDFNFGSNDNYKLPTEIDNKKMDRDLFEHITIGIKPINNNVYFDKEYDNINQDKYDVVKNILYTLDNDIYNKININTEIKVLNFGVNTYINNKLEQKIDENAPIDNLIFIRNGNNIYKYGIENKYYANMIDVESYVKENDVMIETFTGNKLKSIQDKINELFEDLLDEDDGSKEYKKIMKEINNLSKFTPNKDEIIKEFNKDYNLKSIGIKHTKTGLKPNIQYDPSGLSKKDYYDFIENASKMKGHSKLIKFGKILDFDNNGKIKGVIGGAKQGESYSKLFKDAKLLYFIGCKNNNNIGMNYSEKIKDGIVNKNNILATNRLVPDIYTTNKIASDNHIAFRIDLFKTIKKAHNIKVNKTTKK